MKDEPRADLTMGDLIDAHRIIQEAVRLEKEASRLRQMAHEITHTPSPGSAAALTRH